MLIYMYFVAHFANLHVFLLTTCQQLPATCQHLLSTCQQPVSSFSPHVNNPPPHVHISHPHSRSLGQVRTLQNHGNDEVLNFTSLHVSVEPTLPVCMLVGVRGGVSSLYATRVVRDQRLNGGTVVGREGSPALRISAAVSGQAG